MLLIYVAHFSKNREISLSDITTEKEHAAKAAFNNAVNDGEDANALYMSWKAVKDELGMLQAKHRPALVGCRPGDKGSREGKNHDHYTWHQVFV